ncbi:hypothetical protein PUMCH_003564 [Australozyma saopauloensis]|uniref:Rrp15p-domain-containing protein n=1 Tax=Australozyma saopauloensis TaxID=291208 RepID=A0AAX4HCJ2_9ASCO|nr:hypothetical protein PUMCH_003564 [[Candida] saopauloensis]
MAATKKQKLTSTKSKVTKAEKPPVKKATQKIEEKKNESILESDSDLDDEEDIEQESGNDVESGGLDSESEQESDDDSFPLRKQKKETDDGKETFANAFNAIIGSKLKAYDRKDPILARNKATQKKLESDKLEAKARRLIRMEKREEQDRFRVRNLLPSEPSEVRAALETERRMKKIAQKGVVKLFNAILATQVSTSQELAEDTTGMARHPELVNELTKLKFLDLVKAAGEE